MGPGCSPRADGSERQYGKSKLPDDVFEYHSLMPWAKERTGHPTQKPLALLDRMIKASSNPGDLVLDPFCGSAAAPVAADRMGRHWGGVDLSPLAVKLVQQRIMEDNPLWAGPVALDAPPRRTDLGDLPTSDPPPPSLPGTGGRLCRLPDSLPLPGDGRGPMSCPGLRAALTIRTTCNCCVPAVTAARAADNGRMARPSD